MGQLSGKCALITGAKGGLGTFVTQAFLDAGAKVAGVSRSIQASDFPHPEFSAIAAEISSLDAAKAITAQLGRIDVLVHLVGGFAGGKKLAETDDATLERMFALNFWSAAHMIRAVLPRMQEQRSGRILAIGSRVALQPKPGVSAYSASKAALVSLVQTVALENKSAGITANVILPGTMDTPANRRDMPGADYSNWVQPAQVAALLVHLASDQASQISGAVIPVLGGEL